MLAESESSPAAMHVRPTTVCDEHTLHKHNTPVTVSQSMLQHNVFLFYQVSCSTSCRHVCVWR